MNLDSQTNKLISVLTLHSSVYTLQYVLYIQELSKPRTSQKRGPMWKIILWLRNRLFQIFTLSELAFIYNTYLFTNCILETVLVYLYSTTSEFSFFDLCLLELSLLIIHDLQKKYLSINSLNKQTNKLPTGFRGQFLKIWSFLTFSKQTNYKMYRYNRSSCIYLHLAESNHLAEDIK